MNSGDSDGPCLCSPAMKASLEARNGADQIDYISQLVEGGVTSLRESHVLELQRCAVRDIYPCAGKYRDFRMKVYIANSRHSLPEAAFVPTLVQEAVDFVNNGNLDSLSALDRAAYALWRFNWIHPFAGGNGRTSRALAYLIVCMERRYMLPGVPTMPTLVYQYRDEYIGALRKLDQSAADSQDVDLRPMSDFLRKMLVRQLASVVHDLEVPRARQGSL